MTGFIYTRHTGSVELLRQQGFNHHIPCHLTVTEMYEYLEQHAQPGDVIAGIFPLDMHLLLLDMGLEVWCLEQNRLPGGEVSAATMLRHKPRLVEYDICTVDAPLPRGAFVRSWFHRTGVREFAYHNGIVPVDRAPLGVRSGPTLNVPEGSVVIGHGLAKDAADVTAVGGLFWNVDIPGLTLADCSRKLFLSGLLAKGAHLTCYEAVKVRTYIPQEWRLPAPRKATERPRPCVSRQAA